MAALCRRRRSPTSSSLEVLSTDPPTPVSERSSPPSATSSTSKVRLRGSEVFRLRGLGDRSATAPPASSGGWMHRVEHQHCSTPSVCPTPGSEVASFSGRRRVAFQKRCSSAAKAPPSPVHSTRSSVVSALSVEDVHRLRSELRKAVDFDPHDGTVTLTRGDIESIRDVATLEFLAQTPGIAKYVSDSGEDGWRHCSVFVTAVDADGAPTHATIDEDSISLPVDGGLPEGVRPPKRATAVNDFLSCGCSDGSEGAVEEEGEEEEEEEDFHSVPTTAYVTVPSAPSSEAAAASRPASRPSRMTRAPVLLRGHDRGGEVPGYMRVTEAAASKRRDLLREKEEVLERKPPPQPQLEAAPQRRPRPPRIKHTSDGAFSDRNRALVAAGPGRTLTDDEEARIDRILEMGDGYEGGPGTGFSSTSAECAREEQIAAALQRLRPDKDFALLLGAAPQSHSGEQLGEECTSPCKDVPDYIEEMRVRRQEMEKVRELERKLHAHYDSKSAEEEAVRLDREYDDGTSYNRRLAAGTLSELIRGAAEEQGREVPVLEGCDADVAVAAAAADRWSQWKPGASALAADPECVEVGGADVSQLYSAYNDPDQPATPEQLFYEPHPHSTPCGAAESACVAAAVSVAAVAPGAWARFLGGDWEALVRERKADALREISASPFPVPSSVPPTPRLD
eukprot:TRINITY_DN3137_c1_g1_i1.p1 TRINITY_DN3137_c1_g1~~TRINITY_DN3137_c1_g1_i1.p1  ORF type:complete len:679 (+),score=160.13 TRINITY_DN3137_c1_g1_i1:177-2213(+)